MTAIRMMFDYYHMEQSNNTIRLNKEELNEPPNKTEGKGII